MENLFAGIDSSTQSTKLIVIDYDSNQIVFSDSVNYDKDLPKYNTLNGVRVTNDAGVSEADPNMWIDALNILFERLKNSDIPQNKIRAISVSGQQHGLVSLDAYGNLTRSTSKLWNDFSTQEECNLLTDAVGGLENMISEIGNSQRPGYTASKIFHIFRNEPDAYEKTSTFFLVHNFINWFLTGGIDGGIRVMEDGDTSGIALWHPQTKEWSNKVINAISPDLIDKLPEVKPSDQRIGFISEYLSKKYGFDPTCKIDAGSGDNMYGAIGTGNIEKGIVTISLGTSGTAFTILETAFIDPTGEIAAFCDSIGQHFPLVCVSNLANGYNDFIDQHNISHQEFDELISQTEPGNAGRIMIPWFEGERTPNIPEAAPIYFGFGLRDFTKEIIARALIEGEVLNLYNGFQKLPVQVREIRLTGGLSKSESWRQTIADIFGAETVPVVGEGAALGAAIHSAWVWNKEEETNITLSEIVDRFVKLNENERKYPREKYSKAYQKQKELFGSLSNKVRGIKSSDPFSDRSKLINILQNIS